MSTYDRLEQDLDARESVIKTYDMTQVTRKLKSKGFDDADRLETEFRKLATLWLRYPTTSFAPSEQVDEYWHGFILHTRKYADFCDKAFGKFVHHNPTPLNEDLELEGDDSGYVSTLKAYRETFGEIPQEYWPHGTTEHEGIKAGADCKECGTCGNSNCSTKCGSSPGDSKLGAKCAGCDGGAGGRCDSSHG